MSTALINGELSLSYPEGFRLMSTEELQQAYERILASVSFK